MSFFCSTGIKLFTHNFKHLTTYLYVIIIIYIRWSVIMIRHIKWHLSTLLIFLFLTTSFIEAKEVMSNVMEKNGTLKIPNKETLSTDKKIIGAAEKVRLLPANMVLKARIDTGAKTTSIDARDITPFERNGVKWVRFNCVDGNKTETVEKKIIRIVEIKRHGAKPQNRYVVKMRVVLGNVSRLIEVNLNNRKPYEYPVLIGRNFLRDSFIVDIVEKYRFKPMKLKK